MSTGRPDDPFDPQASRGAVNGPATYLEDEPAPMTQPAAGGSGGKCLLWGCLITLALMLLLVIGGGYGVYWFYNKQLQKFTDDQPANIPVVDVSEEEVEAIRQRIEAFQHNVTDETTDGDTTDGETTTNKGDDATDADAEDATDADSTDAVNDTPQELVLNADELNALISSEENLRGKVFVDISDGEVSGQVSIPTDALPGGKGRYFNADGSFDVSMEGGVLVVYLKRASVNGEEIPESVMQGFANENLAKEFYNDPSNAKVLRKFESIEVVDDTIRLKLRPQEQNHDAVPESNESPTNGGDEVGDDAEPTAFTLPSSNGGTGADSVNIMGG